MSNERIVNFMLVPEGTKFISRAAEVLVQSHISKFAKILRFNYPQDAAYSRVEMVLAKDVDIKDVKSALVGLEAALEDYKIAVEHSNTPVTQDDYNVVTELNEALHYIAEGDVDYGSEILTFISEAKIDTGVQFELRDKRIQLTASEAAGAVLDAIKQVIAGIKIR